MREITSHSSLSSEVFFGAGYNKNVKDSCAYHTFYESQKEIICKMITKVVVK